MLATKTSRWTAGTAVLCLIVLAASWFFLVDARRSQAAELKTETVSAQQQAGTLELQLEELRAEFADLPKRRAQLAEIRRQLPAGDDVPRLVRDLESYAEDAGVALSEITPAAPAAVVAPGAAPAPAASTAPAGAPAASSGIFAVPISLKVSGEYVEVSLFVKYLQAKLNRSFLVTGLELAKVEDTSEVASPAATPSPSGTTTATPAPVEEAADVSATVSEVDLTITGQVFVLLESGAGASAPAAGGVATGTGGGSAAGGTTN